MANTFTGTKQICLKLRSCGQKKIVTAVNFGSLKGDDLVNFLKAQKKAAEASGDSYNGNSYWDRWNDGQDGPTLSETNKNTIGHLDLGVDSTLTTIDKLEEDCILVPKESLAKGDAKIEFVWGVRCVQSPPDGMPAPD